MLANIASTEMTTISSIKEKPRVQILDGTERGVLAGTMTSMLSAGCCRIGPIQLTGICRATSGKKYS
ncbi:MAG: hypothetical protein A2X72_16865 [Burkholderiales bacterium GWF1_66_17]|nr:MAG: hypothetical protein A2X73_07705 [Burkholderiales bacterium GWE1_65_30]OGA89392.1 MAG: hypothetical protein A2X72_16865 [Burkholderiales bacterium GWF1_66_17]